MSQELKFSDYKEEINKKCDPIIKKYLEGKAYNQKDAQSWTNSISDEIIKTLHADQKGFKFICNCTIFQKGDASLHFSSTCLWNPNTDGSVTLKFETENMHCFVCLFGIAP